MASANAELGLKIDGILGDAGTLGFEGAFHLSSYSFGLTLPLSPEGRPQQTGALRTEFTVKGEFDSALPQIAQKMGQGQTISSVKLRALSPAVGSARPVVQYKFTDVIIGSLIDTPNYAADELSFSFTRVKISARGHNASTQPNGTSFDYDFARRIPGSLGAAEIDLTTPQDDPATPITASPVPEANQDARTKPRNRKK